MKLTIEVQFRSRELLWDKKVSLQIRRGKKDQKISNTNISLMPEEVRESQIAKTGKLYLEEYVVALLLCSS